MKITTKKIENYETELTIEFEAAELEKYKKRAAKKLAEEVRIPGFRKGKAPQNVLEQHLGKGAILDEASELLVNHGAKEAVKMFNIIPVTEMKPEIVTLEDGKDFVFKLTFTPYPEVKLGEYKNIEVEKVVKPVTDEEVNERLEHLREHQANMVDAPEGSKIADGDFITLDFEGSVDGEKFEGGTAEDYPLTIGSHNFIDDFEEQLIGLKVGDEKEVNVTFPEDYHVKDLAEKPAVFKCKINSIKHKELPALDDEFAKKSSKFQTLDEFKADLRKTMEANAERAAVNEQQEKVIDKAVENMTVDIPPVMIEDRITQMINELEAQLELRGMKLEQYMSLSNTDMDKMREEYRESAEKNVRTDIFLEEVAHKENLKVAPRELDYEIAVMASMYRTSPKQIAKFIRENGQIPTIAANVRRRKAMKFVIDSMAGAEKPEEEKPTEEKPAEEKPAEKKPAEKKSDDEKKSEE